MLYWRATTKGYTKKPNQNEFIEQNKSLVKHAYQGTIQDLAKMIEQRRAVIFCKLKGDNPKLRSDFVEFTNFLVLDVENPKDSTDIWTVEQVGKYISKEFGFKPVMMYYTNSWTKENPKGRLVYQFEDKIEANHYKAIVKELLKDENISTHVDASCTFCSKIFQGGTNVKAYESGSIPKEWTDKIEAQEPKMIPQIRIKYGRPHKDGTKFLVSEREEVRNYINQNIDIQAFLRDKFRILGKKWACPFHANEVMDRPFAVYEKSNSCYCFSAKCNRGYTVMQLAYIYYNSNNFDEVANSLIKEYNLQIDEAWCYKMSRTYLDYRKFISENGKGRVL